MLQELWADRAVGACSHQARSEAEPGLMPLNEWRRQTTGTSAGSCVAAGGLRKHEATGWGRYMLRRTTTVVEW